MASSFIPPTGKALAEIDVAEGVQYGDDFVVIEGVVSPAGGSGWAGKKGYAIYIFSLAAWRLPNHPLVQRELTVLRPVPPSGDDGMPARNVFEEMPPYSIRRMSVLLSDDKSRAVVEKILPIDKPDETLVAFAEELKNPVVLPTEHFGELTLDRTIDWFAGKREWNGVPIDVHFEIGDDGGIVGAITTAERLWADQAAWKRRIDDYAVEQLLPLKNESWLDEGESKLSPKKFKSWMTLTSITVADEGQFQFWHDDGDLFGGHWIEISGNLKDGPNHADIPG